MAAIHVDDILQDVVQKIAALSFDSSTPPATTSDSSLPASVSRGFYGLLPLEILIFIFVHLEVLDIFRCRAVSKAFRAIIDISPQVQYSIELKIAGLEPSLSTSVRKVHEQSNMLRALQNARKQPQAMTLSPTPLTNHFRPKRFGDLFLEPYPADGFWGLDALRCYALRIATGGDANNQGTLQLTKLWDMTLPEGCTLSDCLSDPQQRVLFLYSRKASRAHIYSMSDSGVCFETIINTPERNSKLPIVLAHEVTNYGDVFAVARYFTTFMEQFRALPHQMPSGILDITLISGRLRKTIAASTAFSCSSFATDAISAQYLRIRCDDDRRLSSLKTFSLLSESCFSIALSYPDYLGFDIYAFGPGITTEREETVTPAHIATYEFPPWKPGSWASTTSQCWRTLSTIPRRHKDQPSQFAASQSSAMLLLYLDTEYPKPGTYHNLRFVMFRDTFLASISAYKAQSTPCVVHYPWASWGPTATRCFPEDELSFITSHGYRVMARRGRGLVMLDFNRLDVARDLRNHAPSDSTDNLDDKTVLSSSATSRICAEPSVISGSNKIFLQDICTRVPYRETGLRAAGGDKWRWNMYARYDPDLGGDVWLVAKASAVTSLSTALMSESSSEERCWKI